MRKVGQKVDFEHPELERDLKLKKKKIVEEMQSFKKRDYWEMWRVSNGGKDITSAARPYVETWRGCGSVVEYLPSMGKAPGFLPSELRFKGEE